MSIGCFFAFLSAPKAFSSGFEAPTRALLRRVFVIETTGLLGEVSPLNRVFDVVLPYTANKGGKSPLLAYTTAPWVLR